MMKREKRFLGVAAALIVVGACAATALAAPGDDVRALIARDAKIEAAQDRQRQAYAGQHEALEASARADIQRMCSQDRYLATHGTEQQRPLALNAAKQCDATNDGALPVPPAPIDPKIAAATLLLHLGWPGLIALYFALIAWHLVSMKAARSDKNREKCWEKRKKLYRYDKNTGTWDAITRQAPRDGGIMVRAVTWNQRVSEEEHGVIILIGCAVGLHIAGALSVWAFLMVLSRNGGWALLIPSCFWFISSGAIILAQSQFNKGKLVLFNGKWLGLVIEPPPVEPSLEGDFGPKVAQSVNNPIFQDAEKGIDLGYKPNV